MMYYDQRINRNSSFATAGQTKHMCFDTGVAVPHTKAYPARKRCFCRTVVAYLNLKGQHQHWISVSKSMITLTFRVKVNVNMRFSC